MPRAARRSRLGKGTGAIPSPPARTSRAHRPPPVQVVQPWGAPPGPAACGAHPCGWPTVTGWTRPRGTAAPPENTPEMRTSIAERASRKWIKKSMRESRENNGGNSPGISPNGRVISYNVPEGERPGGIKVRFKIRIATGKRAQEIDARQAAVIMEVLQWQRQHSSTPLRLAASAAAPPRGRAGRAGAGRVPGPDLHPGDAGPAGLAEPAAPRRPGLAAARLVHRRLVLGRRVRRPGPGSTAAAARPGGPFAGAGHAPRRRHGRPARRGRQPRAPVRRGGVRGHRAVRPGHLQRAQTGKEAVPAPGSRCSPPTSPPSSRASTRPRCWSGG